MKIRQKAIQQNRLGIGWKRFKNTIANLGIRINADCNSLSLLTSSIVDNKHTTLLDIPASDPSAGPREPFPNGAGSLSTDNQIPVHEFTNPSPKQDRPFFCFVLSHHAMTVLSLLYLYPKPIPGIHE